MNVGEQCNAGTVPTLFDIKGLKADSIYAKTWVGIGCLKLHMIKQMPKR